MGRRDKQRIAILAFGFAALLFFVVALFMMTLPDVSQATRFAPGHAIQIYDRRLRLVTSIEGNEERQFAPISTVPAVMQQAMLAAEDHSFYQHGGLSFRGIARATLANLGAGRVVEGGSTITQQLAKLLFFDNSDRSIFRKVREAVLALQIEDKLTKQQILETYLNQVYFGRGAFGIEQAALGYFGKHTNQLTLPEAAFLAGVVRAPSLYGDRKHSDEALIRQHEVLDQMIEMHVISVQTANHAKQTQLKFNRSIMPNRKFPYYVSAVMEFLQTQLSADELSRGGLRVYTNMDPVAQMLAERTLARARGSVPAAMNEAGMASVLVEDGSVVALVGGMGDYWKHQWNAATHPHTMGSAFKPFVYLTGFMQGAFTPESRIDDSPIVIRQPNGVNYEPKNFDSNFLGPITIRTAIADSRNVCAVKAAAAVGIENVIRTAQQAGITSKLDPTISLALGASAASPLDMAGAYSTFARGGTIVTPSLVRKVENRNGGTIKDFTKQGVKVFDSHAVQQLVSCLESVVQQGTGSQAQLAGRPVAGKTGTSDEGRDLWFVGFTPDMVTAVWGGNNQHLSVGSNVTGGTVVARLWRDYNQAYYRAHPKPPGRFDESPNQNIFDALLKPSAPAASDQNKDPFQTLAPEQSQNNQDTQPVPVDNGGMDQSQNNGDANGNGTPIPQQSWAQQQQQQQQEFDQQQQQERQQLQERQQQQSDQQPPVAPQRQYRNGGDSGNQDGNQAGSGDGNQGQNQGNRNQPGDSVMPQPAPERPQHDQLQNLLRPPDERN